MIVSYRYPIYPMKDVERKLLASLDTCRWLYNRLSEELNKARESGKTLTTYDTQKLKDKLGKAHERINNQISDFLHKLSRMYGQRVRSNLH